MNISSEDVNALFDEMIKMAKTPRLVCICMSPQVTQFDKFYYCKCGNCGNELSAERWMEIKP